MAEALILAVNITDKMLRTLGQVQQCAQIDNLRAHGLDGRPVAGEHFQIPHVLIIVSKFSHFFLLIHFAQN